MAGQVYTIDNRKNFDKIVSQLGILDDTNVTIGVHEGKAKGASFAGSVRHPGNPEDGRRNKRGDSTIAEIAFFMEFGVTGAGRGRSTDIDERPFIRSTVDKKRKDFESLRDRLLNDIVLKNAGVNQSITKLGFVIQEEIKNTIVTLREPPNEPSTVKAKRANNPLIDSTRLLRSIGYTVNVSKGVIRGF